MRDTQRIGQSMIRRTVLTLATLVVAISVTACSHAMMTTPESVALSSSSS